MSSRAASVGGTLAGGIQDVAALLPLIGTEQCEKHVGSALTRGFLYASATPLSIFGSLGIVKGGTTILISSISMLVPRVSISFANYKPSVKYLGQRKWFGGRVLRDAGFELVGSVAPLIGMEGDRFRAETRLIEMLEEKHIDDTEKVSVDWRSRQWNAMLVLSTILCAFVSMTPYIALLLGPASWRPKSVHHPWLFPALRIVGSCTAVITCQFIIQCRVISLMKNRLLFMIIHQKLTEMRKDKLNAWLKDSNIQWDAALPAEQCIWSLEQNLSSVHAHQDTEQNSVPSAKETPENPHYIAVEMTLPAHKHSPQSTPSAERPSFKILDLRGLQRQHFPTPLRDTMFFSLSWIFLLLSLPATVAGYIGCFTLVSATPSPGNGPLIWVGLEAALSILRVLVWASNPAFDEETDVALRIKLSEHQPIITTHDYPLSNFNTNITKTPFALIPEREFLEHITPYTGPLDQFQKPENVKLYFTLTAKYKHVFDLPQTNNMQLILTVLDSDMDMQIGISLMLYYDKSFRYIDVAVMYDTPSRQLEAKAQSDMRRTRPWRMEDDGLFDFLETSYNYILRALNRETENTSATLFQKWDLSGKFIPDAGGLNIQSPIPTPRMLTLTAEEVLYLDRGFEHYLKSKLMDIWSQRISTDMAGFREGGKLECWEALRDPSSKKRRWELTELDCQLVWGWVQRELTLVNLSVNLEGILQKRMNGCVTQVVGARKDERLRARMSSEHGRLRRKRMEQERQAARKRMEGAMTNGSEQAEKDGRPWEQHQHFSPQWRDAIKFIDEQWSMAILQHGLKTAGPDLWTKRDWMETARERYSKQRNATLRHLRERVSHELWHDQGQLERQMAEATVEAIRKLPSNSKREQLVGAYDFPRPDRYATAKFALLLLSESKGKACSAMVYDACQCDKDVVCDVVAKSTTRSVVNVHAGRVASIPPNDHLLFLSYEDSKGEEPAFVRQNRDRWPGQQTENSSMFYFTPYGVDALSCWVRPGKTIAHILVFLTSSCNLHVSLIHRAEHHKTIAVSLQQNGTELATLSDVSDTFQLNDFPPVVLPEGRHELKLVPEFDSGSSSRYFLRDVIITFSPVITLDSNAIQRTGTGIPIPVISTPSEHDVLQSNQEVSVVIENPSEPSDLCRNLT